MLPIQISKLQLQLKNHDRWDLAPWPLYRAHSQPRQLASAVKQYLLILKQVSCPVHKKSIISSPSYIKFYDVDRHWTFCWCFKGNAVGYVDWTIEGPFIENIGALIAPSESTCVKSGKLIVPKPRWFKYEIRKTDSSVNLNKNVRIKSSFFAEKQSFREGSHHTAIIYLEFTYIIRDWSTINLSPGYTFPWSCWQLASSKHHFQPPPRNISTAI